MSLGQRHHDRPFLGSRLKLEAWKAPPVHILTHLGRTPPTKPGAKYGDSGWLARCGVILEWPKHLAYVTPDDPQDCPPCPRCGSLADFEAVEQAIAQQAAESKAQRESEERDREIEYNWANMGRQINRMIIEALAEQPDTLFIVPAGLLLNLLDQHDPSPDLVSHYLRQVTLSSRIAMPRPEPEPEPTDQPAWYYR